MKKQYSSRNGIKNAWKALGREEQDKVVAMNKRKRKDPNDEKTRRDKISKLTSVGFLRLLEKEKAEKEKKEAAAKEAKAKAVPPQGPQPSETALYEPQRPQSAAYSFMETTWEIHRKTAAQVMADTPGPQHQTITHLEGFVPRGATAEQLRRLGQALLSAADMIATAPAEAVLQVENNLQDHGRTTGNFWRTNVTDPNVIWRTNLDANGQNGMWQTKGTNCVCGNPLSSKAAKSQCAHVPTSAAGALVSSPGASSAPAAAQ